jgi:hypothetical protein
MITTVSKAPSWVHEAEQTAPWTRPGVIAAVKGNRRTDRVARFIQRGDR